MTVSEVLMVMLMEDASHIECGDEIFRDIFEFNDKYGDRVIDSVSRIHFEKTHEYNVAIVRLKKYEEVE